MILLIPMFRHHMHFTPHLPTKSFIIRAGIVLRLSSQAGSPKIPWQAEASSMEGVRLKFRKKYTGLYSVVIVPGKLTNCGDTEYIHSLIVNAFKDVIFPRINCYSPLTITFRVELPGKKQKLDFTLGQSIICTDSEGMPAPFFRTYTLCC